MNADLKYYIQVDGINGLYGNPVAISKLLEYNSLRQTYRQAHLKLHKNGRYMATPAIFMTHFKNVIAARRGEKKLYYADGTLVPEKDIENIYEHLTKDGTRVWLNAKFLEENREWFLETVIGVENKYQLITEKEPLEYCVMDNRYVELEFNNQGLPIKESDLFEQKYKRGKNIYFWYPENGKVASFGTNSDKGVYLACDKEPNVWSPLGVFGCIEGVLKFKIER